MAIDYTTTTLRIPTAILEAFQKVLKNEPASGAGKKHPSMNAKFTEWIEAFNQGNEPSGARPQLNSESQALLADMLAATVAQLLKFDTSWALNVVRSAHLRWPADGVLKERMGHFPMDKVYVSHKFSEWLASRVAHLLENEDVYILMDAGSTILYFCYQFWNHLEKLSRTRRNTKITIVSTNLPAAHSFTEQCHLNRFAGETDIVFQLLGGTVQYKYAALVGGGTAAALASMAKGNGAPGNKRRGRYITLLAGNYIRLREKGNPAVPIPLIRGTGQKAVKEAYVLASDEIYILGAAPGKIFDGSHEAVTRAIKEALEAKTGDKPKRDMPQLRSESPDLYADVNIPVEKRDYVKLVTTGRHSTAAILTPHSAAFAARLGTAGVDIESDEGNSARVPLNELPNMHHFIYPYNEPVQGKTDEDQLRIEFPHLDWGKPGQPPPPVSVDLVKKFFHIKTLP